MWGWGKHEVGDGLAIKNYDISPRGYLKRARRLLNTTSKTNLRYAALELRCCVESRQADYLDALSSIINPKIKNWETAKVSKALGRIWKEPKIARIVYHLPIGDWTTYFTPISKSLVDNSAKETGLLLHALNDDTMMQLDWWSQRHDALISLYRDVWISCRGEHIAMPIWNAKTREPQPWLLYVEDEYEDFIKCLANQSEQGKKISFYIDYLDCPPAEWICDL